MNIVVCYKCVPDDECIKPVAGKPVDLAGVPWKVGTYDLNAVEAGMQLFEQLGGSIKALSAAGPVAVESKMKKAILSRGPEEQVAVVDEALDGADSLTVAKALAAAIKGMDNVDLVLFGEGSGDRYSQQVGSLVGFLLGWNTVNGVSGIAAEGEGLKVTRTLEDSVQELQVPFPAVVSVTSDINKARIANMKSILAAGKKPSTQLTLADVGAAADQHVTVESIVAPEATARACNIIEGDGSDAIAAFANELKKLL